MLAVGFIEVVVRTKANEAGPETAIGRGPVIYVLTRLDDRRGLVTKSTTCARAQVAEGGDFTGRSGKVSPVT